MKRFIFCLFFYLNVFAQNSFQAQENIPSHLFKLGEVVGFQIIQHQKEHPNIIALVLETKKNFKIYQENLEFYFVPTNSLPYAIEHKTQKPAQTYFDPFYKKEKKIYENGTIFYLENHLPVTLNDSLEIHVQACSKTVCSLPTKLILKTQLGSKSYENTQSSLEFFPTLNTQTNVEPSTPLISSQKELSFEERFNNSLEYQIQNALKTGSLLLFPALFLAGLFMNLTPCVYPMIPITLHVMFQLGENKRKSKSLPIFYVGGVVFAYCLLGLFAGMTGSLFGSQLASPSFRIVISIFMFFLGFSLLGYFHFSALQTFANKIPVAKNYPHLAAGTMGAVSGLVAAPCTGPILSMILILIAQNKNPLIGFTSMFIFALGFGFPYLALGFLGQNLAQMPKFPKLIYSIKIFFATFMFALGLYFARFIFEKIPFIQNIFFRPHIVTLSLSIFLFIFFSLFLTYKKSFISKTAHIFVLTTGTLLALWLSLSISKGFSHPKNSNSQKIVNISPIKMETNIDVAMHLSQKLGKPLLIDVWATWCNVCLEMKASTWQDENLAKYLNEHYIVAEINLTNENTSSTNINNWIQKWGIQGLPSVGFFKSPTTFEKPPQILYQGFVSAEKVLETAKNLK
jgi:thiol:disulfide interchange protein DsbD